MRPLRVTAHLEAGLAHATSWGISLDGLLVAFDSGASNLVPADRNRVNDIFIRTLVP